MSLITFTHNRKQAIDCLAKITTTLVITTVSQAVYGSEFLTAGYSVGTFITRVVANASGAPKVQLQGRVDTTTWAVITTLIADITTTANNTGKIVTGLPDVCRIAVTSGSSATTHMRLSVKAMRQVII